MVEAIVGDLLVSPIGSKVLIIAVVVPAIVVATIAYVIIYCFYSTTVTVVEVKAPITRTCYPSTIYGVVVSKAEAIEFLNKIGLSLNDLILVGNWSKVVYLYPVYQVRYWRCLRKYFNASDEDREVYYLSRDGLIVVVGSDDMVLINITYGVGGHREIVYDPVTGDYIETLTLIPSDFDLGCISGVYSIIYIDAGIEYNNTFNGSIVDSSIVKARLLENFTQTIVFENESIKACSSNPQCFGPCVSPRIEYYMDWPILLYPKQKCCKYIENNHKWCVTYPASATTMYNKVFINIQSYENTEKVLQQLEIIINKLSTK